MTHKSLHVAELLCFCHCMWSLLTVHTIACSCMCHPLHSVCVEAQQLGTQEGSKCFADESVKGSAAVSVVSLCGTLVFAQALQFVQDQQQKVYFKLVISVVAVLGTSGCCSCSCLFFAAFTSSMQPVSID